MTSRSWLSLPRISDPRESDWGENKCLVLSTGAERRDAIVIPPLLPGPLSLVSTSLLAEISHLCRSETSGETLKSQNKVAVQAETVVGGQCTIRSLK